MALSPNRIHQGAETDYPWEREAIDFVIDGLPDVDPYQVWPLHEFLDPGTGRLYEVDLLVLGRNALYLIEIKSNPGVLRGDSRDWVFTHQGQDRPMENPLYLTNKKAKALSGLLRRKMPPSMRIWVEPLVFLSNQDLELRLQSHGRSHVVTRGEVIRAITHGEYSGANAKWVVNRPLMREVSRALEQLGLRASPASRRVGEYKLSGLISEGPGYQEHLGEHSKLSGRTCRIRSYLVPRATSVERRSKLERAARREASSYTELGEHPNILRCNDYIESTTLGPALLFEPFERGLPLDLVLRLNPELAFDTRMEIIRQLAEALHFCHRRQLLHRNLSPATVLVREKPDGGVEVKLHSFQLAMRQEGSMGTSHLSELTEDEYQIYQAPEVLDSPAQATVASDVFSLGALACFILTGQPPARDIVERERILREQKCLSIAGLRDDLSAKIDAVIGHATEYHAVTRADNAIYWYQLLEEEATLPENDETATILDPYDAEKGTELEGGLIVKKVLGSGATARGLLVEMNGQQYALKVPHDEGCVERLQAEADVLAQLRHSHIVESYGMRTVGGRDCLLLRFAGEKTLADMLREEGTIGLDYARRFGDDLLSALQYLEDQRVQHRDIKPSNIGFTDPKQAKHLILFDFSLSDIDAPITVGTPAYRDPFLRMRGQWDEHADRYSLAVTLYEMLTGSRPDIRESEGSELQRTVALEAERFDAAVRDRMLVFFQRAFSPDVTDRFVSAEEMKTAWLGIFADPLYTSITPEAETSAIYTTGEQSPRLRREVAADLDTPVDALNLSNRARNALDRAGIATVQELLQLPRNQLSAVRGVGRLVAQEVQQVAEELRRDFADLEDEKARVFVAEYRGPDEALKSLPELNLDRRVLRRLRDAGITTSGALASASRGRIERLLHGLTDIRALRNALQSLRREDEYSLESWCDEIFPLRRPNPRTWQKRLRILCGLDPLIHATTKQNQGLQIWEAMVLTKALGVSRQIVYKGLQQAREYWTHECPGLALLQEACEKILEAAGGVIRLEDAATELARAFANTGEIGELQLRQASALWYMLGALHNNENGQHLHARRVNGAYWIAIDTIYLDVLLTLGNLAQQLAFREPLPSSETVLQELSAVVSDTPLMRLAPDQLVTLAARASESAAPSTRLELYPRGMAAERALSLSVAALAQPALKVEDIHRRVQARYPEATPLPERPELDKLLRPHGLFFEQSTQSYVRETPKAPTSRTMVPFSLQASALHNQPTQQSPEADAFQEQLRNSVERGRFRVLQVPAHLSDKATRKLTKWLNVQPTSIDLQLWQAIERKGQELQVQHDNITAADREGPDGKHWPLLCTLVSQAAREFLHEILEQRTQPRFLVPPGLLARYNLNAELQELVERSEQEDGAAVLLLVPSHDHSGAPSINHRLPVPAPLPGQRLRIPKSWLVPSTE